MLATRFSAQLPHFPAPRIHAAPAHRNKKKRRSVLSAPLSNFRNLNRTMLCPRLSVPPPNHSSRHRLPALFRPSAASKPTIARDDGSNGSTKTIDKPPPEG